MLAYICGQNVASSSNNNVVNDTVFFERFSDKGLLDDLSRRIVLWESFQGWMSQCERISF